MQVHFYGLGPSDIFTWRAPYDQFLSTDYSTLFRDVHYNYRDEETRVRQRGGCVLWLHCHLQTTAGAGISAQAGAADAQ